MEKIHFPVFVLSEGDGKDVLAKAHENKRLDSWPKWAAEFKAFMWGAIDSETCLRRGYCDPVGGESLWGTFEEGELFFPPRALQSPRLTLLSYQELTERGTLLW